MATPRNSVERRFRVVDEGQYPLFLRRLLLKLVPFGSWWDSRAAGIDDRARGRWCIPNENSRYLCDCKHDRNVINEDRVVPGGGFPSHGHRYMEIITYVLDGVLK
jgi:hypothetical protein